MLLYRITRKVWAQDLTGTGSRLFGGRWNNVGRSLTYLAGSRSLAVLEVLVHIRPACIPDDYVLTTWFAPEDVTDLNIDKLPKGWNDVYPPLTLRNYGDEFLSANKHLLLKVPSAIVPQEFNYLLNPEHRKVAEVKLISVDSFSFDERLV